MHFILYYENKNVIISYQEFQENEVAMAAKRLHNKTINMMQNLSVGLINENRQQVKVHLVKRRKHMKIIVWKEVREVPR